ncbi:MAG: TnsA endonuclease N-terminal domain-containing protein [Sulfuricurvum sp.]
MAVRKIKKSYRSVTGYFMSRKNNRQLAFESTLEHDFFLTLEFDPSVVSFEEQPFKLRYECDGTNRFYTPDALVHYHNSSTVFEVKYKNELDSDEELRQKLSCITNQIESEGKYNFTIFTDTTFDQIYLQNLKFLYKFAFLKNTEKFDERFKIIYENLSGISLMDFLYAIDTDSSHHGKVIPYLWHFLALNPSIIDLTHKLSMNSPLIKDSLWQK